MSKHHKPVYLIAAADKNNGIGANGTLVWHLKDDLKFFQKTTEHTDDFYKENAVIMGRTTWESIPENHRPLKGRRNLVLTRNEDYQVEGGVVFHSFDDAIKAADKDDNIEKIFVIGGAHVYRESLSHARIAGIYLTRIDAEHECDAFFPEIPHHFSDVTSFGKGEENGTKFEFLLYKKQTN